MPTIGEWRRRAGHGRQSHDLVLLGSLGKACSIYGGCGVSRQICQHQTWKKICSNIGSPESMRDERRFVNIKPKKKSACMPRIGKWRSGRQIQCTVVVGFQVKDFFGKFKVSTTREKITLNQFQFQVPDAKSLFTVPIADTLSGKNVHAWVSVVSYLKKWIKIKILKQKQNPVSPLEVAS